MSRIKAKDIIIFSIMLVLVLGLTVVVLLGAIPFKHTVEKELSQYAIVPFCVILSII